MRSSSFPFGANPAVTAMRSRFSSLPTSESARREFDEHAVGFAISEIESSYPSSTGSTAAFFIENELPDGVESGQARLGKSIVLAGRMFGPL
jgi:hypothetical protein